uniref:Keratin 80 n=1 Tax=Sphenodon punctatus TaxID=8508 RepID=A0A8D0GJM3_SPHPU
TPCPPCIFARDSTGDCRVGFLDSAIPGMIAGKNVGSAPARNFSSSSLSGYGPSSYQSVSFDKRLLDPLHLDVDPEFQGLKTREKDEIKTLNNQFASLIGKVQSLEQHNQVLLTRWNFLKEQTNSHSKTDIKRLYDQYMGQLKEEMRAIDGEKEQLDSELEGALDTMDNLFTPCSLVSLQDLDDNFLHKTELEAKLNGLGALTELMKTVHEQELEQLMNEVKEVSVVMGFDTQCKLDLNSIVEDVRAQYEAMAVRSWEELEALTRSKEEEQSAQYGHQLLNSRREIAELNIQIQKIRSCILSQKSQCLKLEESIHEVEYQGELALKDAKAKLANLEDALQVARQDMARLVKEYQELMNIKLALDIEILTYRKLVEGEESR